MRTSRRNFITAGAAASVLVASEAKANPNAPWICFLHSTQMVAKWQSQFFAGLKNFYEGNPASDAAPTVNILSYHAHGNYTKLSNAVSNLIKEVNTRPQLFVTAGGMVSALSAIPNTDYGDGLAPISVLALVGRQILPPPPLPAGLQLGAYYIDKIITNPDGTATNSTLLTKAKTLRDNYGKPFNAQWLIYNANSSTATSEVAEWQRIVGLAGQAIDASYSGGNDALNLRKAFNDALNQGAQAIVLSADPQFFTKAHRIVAYAKSHPGLIMCYPFQEYDAECADLGLSAQADYMIYGPDMGQAYLKLGYNAGQYIINPYGAGNPGGFKLVQNHLGQYSELFFYTGKGSPNISP